MITFLEKLERKAAQFLDTMDSQLQEPVVRVISGEVFTHDSVSEAYHHEDLLSQQALPGVNTILQPKPRIGAADFERVQADFAECQVTEFDPITLPVNIRVSGIL